MANEILPGIEHVVVLMFENRSFDNVLGDLYPGKPQSEYNGLTGNETNPAGACNPNANLIKVFQGPTNIETMVMPFPDPGELFNEMNEQQFGCCTLEQYNETACPDTGAVTMTGFVAQQVADLLFHRAALYEPFGYGKQQSSGRCGD